jgi:hypothetical protein
MLTHHRQAAITAEDNFAVEDCFRLMALLLCNRHRKSRNCTIFAVNASLFARKHAGRHKRRPARNRPDSQNWRKKKVYIKRQGRSGSPQRRRAQPAEPESGDILRRQARHRKKSLRSEAEF